MWVQIESITNKESINRLIKFASKNGYNHLLVQIRSRDYVAYNSKLVSKYNQIDKNFDPLEYIINIGHKHKIKIHAWINMYICWSGRNVPLNKNHLLLE